MAQVQVRNARLDEIEALIPLFEWLLEPPGSTPTHWSPERAKVALRAAIESPDAAVLVAVEGEGLVGVCTAYCDLHSVRFGPRGWVENLAVDPARRSGGIGKLLLDAAKDWARACGATHLKLDSGEGRADAHRFYERERPSWRAACFAWEL